CVEVVRLVQRVVADVLEGGAVKRVAARLGDDAHLPTAAGPEFSRVGARLDAEFLDVLEARLQLEWRGDLPVQGARRGGDDRRTFDAVVADRVLLDGAAAEADVLPGAGPGVLRARRLQHQLRHLPAVHRKAVHLALAEVDPDLGGAEIDDRRRTNDRDLFL